MTAADWLTATQPRAMMRFARVRASARKLQLVGCAACRLVWDLLPDGTRALVETVERYVDGRETWAKRFAAAVVAAAEGQTLADLAEDPNPRYAAVQAAVALTNENPADALERCAQWVEEAVRRAAPAGEKQAALARVRRDLCDRFREVIPYHLWKAIPDSYGGGLVQPDGRTVHLTAAARELAAGVRAELAFDRLPILADALEESGVTDPALLAHCRAATGHVRGCWAVDVLPVNG